MKKETAVEWLVEQIKSDQNQKALSASEWMEVIEQAKAMEREQIIEAFDEGQEYEYQYYVNGTPKFDSETYFNETYKRGNNE